mmetsp:Transcript_11977/g.35321  ORF Transcript_11977/g.35321 Transcript_11977/m.35321 type:complete len:257 (-) Transcript_11977:315-1085(-)
MSWCTAPVACGPASRLRRILQTQPQPLRSPAAATRPTLSSARSSTSGARCSPRSAAAAWTCLEAPLGCAGQGLLRRQPPTTPRSSWKAWVWIGAQGSEWWWRQRHGTPGRPRCAPSPRWRPRRAPQPPQRCCSPNRSPTPTQPTWPRLVGRPRRPWICAPRSRCSAPMSALSPRRPRCRRLTPRARTARQRRRRRVGSPTAASSSWLGTRLGGWQMWSCLRVGRLPPVAPRSAFCGCCRLTPRQGRSTPCRTAGAG